MYFKRTLLKGGEKGGACPVKSILGNYHFVDSDKLKHSINTREERNFSERGGDGTDSRGELISGGDRSPKVWKSSDALCPPPLPPPNRKP